MTRTTFRTWTATTPTTMPRSRCAHGAGNARIAATSTSVASTPLQPASIDTANGLVDDAITLPCVVIVASNVRISPADADATASVHGVTKCACANGVSSNANASASRTTNTTRKRRMAADSSACAPGKASGARERRTLREVAADALGDRVGEALLLARVAQLALLVGIRDERGFDENRRNVGRLQHREARLLDDPSMQRVVRSDALEHLVSDLEAVVDLRGL